MIILCKSINENDGEISFCRVDGELAISIMNGHATTYYRMTKEEINALIKFIKVSDEWMD